MPLDEVIRQKELRHQELVESIFHEEGELQRLYFERSTTSELLEKLAKEKIEVQLEERGQNHEVHLKKENSFTICVAQSLSSALIGAYTALCGERAHAL